MAMHVMNVLELELDFKNCPVHDFGQQSYIHLHVISVSQQFQVTGSFQVIFSPSLILQLFLTSEYSAVGASTHDVGEIIMELVERIQALPPELFNEIQKEVLEYQPLNRASDGFNYEHITTSYRHPYQLHLNRSFRADFAHQYFSNTIFILTLKPLFEKFLASLAEEHLATILGFRLHPYKGSTHSWWSREFDRPLGDFILCTVHSNSLVRIGEQMHCIPFRAKILAVVHSDAYNKWVDRVEGST